MRNEEHEWGMAERQIIHLVRCRLDGVVGSALNFCGFVNWKVDDRAWPDLPPWTKEVNRGVLRRQGRLPWGASGGKLGK
jgi:hypothetical protein